jgi:hypothetical protein
MRPVRYEYAAFPVFKFQPCLNKPRFTLSPEGEAIGLLKPSLPHGSQGLSKLADRLSVASRSEGHYPDRFNMSS